MQEMTIWRRIRNERNETKHKEGKRGREGEGRRRRHSHTCRKLLIPPPFLFHPLPSTAAIPRSSLQTPSSPVHLVPASSLRPSLPPPSAQPQQPASEVLAAAQLASSLLSTPSRCSYRSPTQVAQCPYAILPPNSISRRDMHYSFITLSDRATDCIYRGSPHISGGGASNEYWFDPRLCIGWGLWRW